MQNSNNKTIATAATLLLMLSIAVSLIAVPVNAHDPPVNVKTYAFISVNPNPIGVGQTVAVIMFLHGGPPGSSSQGGTRYIFNLFVKTPTGENQSLGQYYSDSTGSAAVQFVPEELGTYEFTVNYPGQVITGKNPVNGIEGTATEFLGDTFLPSTKSVSLTVQEEQLTKLPDTPLPTEYWTRPIEGQNSAWSSIASNWVGGAKNDPLGVNVQEYGTGPMSSHIRWTMPIELGGIVGGTDPIASYWGGGAYSERLSTPLIISGRVYFQLPLGGVATGGMNSPAVAGGYVCVDLQTGETLWENGDINPTKAQLYDFESENQHGVVGGLLWQVSGTTWSSYDAFTGKWCYNLTNVPNGFEAYTDQGEIVRYVLNYDARWLALWNNTDCGQGYFWRPVKQSIDMSNAYSWNATIPDLTGLAAPSIYYVAPGDVILGTSTSWPFTSGFFQTTSNPITVWALSDKPGSKGQLLWIKNYSVPESVIYATRQMGPVDMVNRVFTMYDRGLTTWYGYDLDSGELLWTKQAVLTSDLSYYIQSTANIGMADGKLFTSSYGGEVACYSTLNGDVLWVFNDTFSGLETPWGNTPMFMSYVADGVVYAYNNEHSANDPLYKGYKVYAINATTGDAIWTLLGWMGECGGSATYALADGSLVYYNSYDGQVYCIGKGPTATTVTIQDDVVTEGDSVLIKGTVIDTSGGTNNNEQATRFTNGVPAVSEDSMSDWMAYVYMQKSIPTDAVGVEVSIDVLDANNNYRNIGTVTSDANGFYSFAWTPDIPGKYTVYATFGGSTSYWGSFAETAFNVEEAPAATPEPTPAPQSIADMYFVPAVIGIIVAIIVAAIVIVLMLRKR